MPNTKLPIVADVAAYVRMGGKIQDILPEGADPNYWQGLVNRFNARANRPKRTRRTTTRRSYGRNKATKAWSANQVIGRVTIELVDRHGDGQPKLLLAAKTDEPTEQLELEK